MDPLQIIRDHLLALLRGGQAYEPFGEIVGDFPPELRSVVPPGAEHSAWQIVEHMRIALRDILDFSQNENGTYQEKDWPDDYWPKSPQPPAPDGWERTVQAYIADRAELERLVADPGSDLLTPFRWGDGQTFLREALLAADHASYHLGQLVVLRELLA